MEDTRKVQETSVAGGGLEHLRQQLQDWSTGRKRGERIPAPLWAAAVNSAREQGLHCVATRLNLWTTLGSSGGPRAEGGGATPPRGEVAVGFPSMCHFRSFMLSPT